MEHNIDHAWIVYKYVLAVLPTGGGKTVIFSNIISRHRGASCAIAHRQELVSQISLALAKDGVRHRIIGPPDVVRLCVSIHMAELGVSYYDPSALCAVAGVDTLVRRGDKLRGWLNSVTLVVQDEAHHLLKENKWGKAFDMFPNAKYLGVTATPCRADGKGLGAHCDGVFNTLIQGPGLRDLIRMGYLTDYRVFSPQSDVNVSDVNVSTTTGDYNPAQLKIAVRRSKIVGDVVDHYLRIAPGKLGVTFASDVETATDIARQFNARGVPAEVVSAETPNEQRVAAVRKFKNRELLQLVNVDLFGEGFDLPAVEVVSFARPTMSYGLYCQQFGRALRLLIEAALQRRWGEYTDAQRWGFIAGSKKPCAIIIDHVNNVVRHGLPDRPRKWSLDAREKRSSVKDEGAVPVRACPKCTGVYERIFKVCPYCGFVPVPAVRTGPEFVDGDLTELDPEVLARMRGEVAKVDMSEAEYRDYLASRYVPRIGQLAGVKRHREHQDAQHALRENIAWWAGYRRAENRPDSESYRLFYFLFGVDVLSAQALGTKESNDLNEKIMEALKNDGHTASGN
jgi:superfamily II DNA or RNA helicase